MIFRITAQVVVKESRMPLPGLVVKAYDKDLLFDDLLGSATSDWEGNLEIVCEGADFQELFDKNPDIYLRVMDADWSEMFSTEDKVRFASGQTEHFLVEIPWDNLPEGIREATANPESVQLIRDLLTPEERSRREFPWQETKGALLETANTHTPVGEEILLEVALGLEGPIQMAEGSGLPGVMPPADTLRAIAIEQLAKWTGQTHREEIEDALAGRESSTLYSLAMHYLSG